MPTDAIRAEIRDCGVIPFSRFMELALYCPETGYYERNQDSVGRRGDFITSVSTGSLFGELLAFQFAEWLVELPAPERKLQIAEAGAHDGKLAGDVLCWLQKQRPKLFSKIEYCIFEPSALRQQWQRETLKTFGNVRWITCISDCPPQQFNGIIFSNELLDAFPVRRFGWDAKSRKWFEWGVTLDDGKFSWKKIERPTRNYPFSILDLPSSLLEVLPDGYTIEDSPAAENWWRTAAGILAHGRILAIDYGFTAGEQFSPARVNGTLRTYHRHHAGDDLLANPGEQDLTAHVNFTAIQKVGEDAGLKTEMFCTQPQFLTRILGRAAKDRHFTGLDANAVRQFQTLTHPEHLGRAFRVLAQGK